MLFTDLLPLLALFSNPEPLAQVLTTVDWLLLHQPLLKNIGNLVEAFSQLRFFIPDYSSLCQVSWQNQTKPGSWPRREEMKFWVGIWMVNGNFLGRWCRTRHCRWRESLGLGTKADEKVWCAQEQQASAWLEQSHLSVTLDAVTRELNSD